MRKLIITNDKFYFDGEKSRTSIVKGTVTNNIDFHGSDISKWYVEALIKQMNIEFNMTDQEQSAATEVILEYIEDLRK